MRIQLTIDLDRLLSNEKGKAAFERFFTHLPADEEQLMKDLGVDKMTLSFMISYMVTKTMLDDDGKGQAYKVLGLGEEQKEAGR